MSEPVLTALVRDAVAKSDSPVPLRDISVMAEEGQLVVQGRTEGFGQHVDGRLAVRPVVEHGWLRMDVVDAHLGALPIPSRLADVIGEPMNERLRALLADLPATIISVAVRAGEGLAVAAELDTEAL